jgi:hypothetical protein
MSDKPGAYYLANGLPAIVWSSCGSLLCRSEAESPDFPQWADAPTAAWATGPDGGPVRVPTLGEWEEARRERNALADERDALRSEVALLREVRARWQALREALGVPEGVDAVDWAGALVALSGAAMALVAATDSESGQAVALLGLREALEALHATRPMPDGPGDWWGRYGRHELRAVHVCWRSGDLVGVAHRQSRPDAAWVDVKSDRWTWLAGPDGKAVRCTPPEVTRD